MPKDRDDRAAASGADEERDDLLAPVPGCDENGRPLDPFHPWNLDQRTAEAARRDWIAERLAAFERAACNGELHAVERAVAFCRRAGEPPPAWIEAAVGELLAWMLDPPKRTGRHARPGTRYREFLAHHARWDAVHELRDAGATFDDAFATAAERLNVSEDTVRASYKRMEKVHRRSG